MNHSHPHHPDSRPTPNVRRDTRNITVSQAVDAYLDWLEMRGLHTREHRSVLKGARNRVYGVAPKGSALSQTHLGTLPMRRTTWQDYSNWFSQRHPKTMAASSRKRGMSSLRGFLRFSVECGWADASVMQACGTIRASAARRHWLRPETVKAITPLLARPKFDEMDRFAYETLLAVGVRVSELITMREDHLNALDRTLEVCGKGAGDGKLRVVPVDDDYIDRFEAYVRSQHIAPGGYLFFYRRFVQVQGAPRGTMECVEEDRSRHIGPKPIRAMTTALAELANEELPGELSPGTITPHVMRHTYACLHTIRAELNTDGGGSALGLRSLQMAMGHESLETTAQYLGDVANYLTRHRRLLGTLKTVDDILSWVRRNAG